MLTRLPLGGFAESVWARAACFVAILVPTTLYEFGGDGFNTLSARTRFISIPILVAKMHRFLSGPHLLEVDSRHLFHQFRVPICHLSIPVAVKNTTVVPPVGRNGIASYGLVASAWVTTPSEGSSMKSIFVDSILGASISLTPSNI